MIFDIQNLLSDKQAVTTGTQYSTNALDAGVGATIPGGSIAAYGTALHDLGRGMPVEVLVMVNTTFTGGTSLQVNLVAATANDLTTGQVVLQSSAVIAEASLVSGYQFRVVSEIPPGNLLRFLGLQFVTVGTHGAGTITAGVVWSKDSNYAPL